MSNVEMVSWWKQLAVGSDLGGGSVGGHSARRSGAKFFCRCGWQPWQIQFHGRWGSDAVLGYTEEVFAEVSGSWRLDGAVSESVAGAVGCVESEGAGVGRADGLPASGEGESLPALAQRVAVELDTRARFVVNRREMKLHKAASCGVDTPSEAWSTICGWRFARQGSWVLQYTDSADGAVKCDHCFRPRSCGAE